MNRPLRALNASLVVFVFLCFNADDCFGGTTPTAAPQQTVIIPGPLRSFERMAAISQKVPVEKVLPLFARNVGMMAHVPLAIFATLALLGLVIRRARQELAEHSETRAIGMITGEILVSAPR